MYILKDFLQKKKIQMFKRSFDFDKFLTQDAYTRKNMRTSW